MGANWLDPDRLTVRLLLVGLMFASLLMSVAIGDSFDGRAWLFVTGCGPRGGGGATSCCRGQGGQVVRVNIGDSDPTQHLTDYVLSELEKLRSTAT